MKGYLVLAGIVLGGSLFCGFIGLSVGLASFFPPLDQIAAPFACQSHRLEIVQNHRSGGRVDLTAYCVNSDGVRQQPDVTTSVEVIAGLIYSLGFWVVYFFGLIGLNARLEASDKRKARAAAPPPPAARS